MHICPGRFVIMYNSILKRNWSLVKLGWGLLPLTWHKWSLELLSKSLMFSDGQTRLETFLRGKVISGTSYRAKVRIGVQGAGQIGRHVKFDVSLQGCLANARRSQSGFAIASITSSEDREMRKRKLWSRRQWFLEADDIPTSTPTWPRFRSRG